MRARRNRSGGLPVASTLELTPMEVQRGAKASTDWHWGVGPSKVLDVKDPQIPAVMLIECGRLIRLHVRVPQDGKVHPRRVRDAMIEFSKQVSRDAHLAYDPDHPDERLYILLPESARRVLKQRFWDENRASAVNLNQLALAIGGRHGKRADYPSVLVKPVGILTAVVYYTNKKGDGPSYYIHKIAELSSLFPALAIDQRGRLWIAGGNTTAPTPGITD